MVSLDTAVDMKGELDSPHRLYYASLHIPGYKGILQRTETQATDEWATQYE
jgi:hypothetical protein